MSRKLFVNIAVEDLPRSVEFFGKLGFSFDPFFTDETATCMLVGEDAYFMLVTRERFGEFRAKPLADAATQTEAIYAVSAETREEVDDLVEKALAEGGSPAKEPMDQGFMYGRSFHDPDGHHFEVIWMDPKVLDERERTIAAAAGEA
jgi:predicted lactoylglutathione lyase